MSSDRNSVCRSSAMAGGGGGGGGSCSSRGGSCSKGKSGTKKAGWEDAGVEFYREAYPTTLDSLYDGRLTTLLPSKRHSVTTLGRGTTRRRSSIKNRRGNATLVHTNRRGSDTYLEVLPDLAQGVDEEETWNQLQQIRSYSTPMEEKRKLKRQLLSAPTLRTRGLAALKLSKKKFVTHLRSHINELIGKLELWRWSLRYVEGNFGTGLVAFFSFIKWLLYLNIFATLLIAVFIVVPILFLDHPQDMCLIEDAFNSTVLNGTKADGNSTLCCFEEYKEIVESRKTYSGGHLVLQLVLQFVQGTGIFEVSYLFYGRYPRVTLTYSQLPELYYSVPLAYLLIMVLTLALCLILMVREAARGLRESLRSSEGQFYQFCSLVFGGWDYCIENNKAAAVKKRSIYNELCNHLETERYNEEKEQRTKRERCRLYFVRILVNIIVVIVLGFTFAAIYKSTSYSLDHGMSQCISEEGTEEPVCWEKLLYEYLPASTIVMLNIIVPYIFRLLVQVEHYTPNLILTVTLLRTVFLLLASLVVLLASIYHSIGTCMLSPAADSCFGDECHDQVLCWETYVGQQLYRLTLLDLLIMIIQTFLVNFPRKIIGHQLFPSSRVGSYIGNIEFSIPKHVLSIVYGQTLCWLGMFYSPLLPAIFCIKLVLVFYIKYFDCTVNSTQSSQLYHTSRSNALFISILLFSFIVTIIPVGYSIAEIRPSFVCGPFHGLPSIWSEMVTVIEDSPESLKSRVFFLGTAGFAVPAIILLILVCYYYYAVAAANKHMVGLLKHQLVLEGHDKQFLLKRLDQMMKQSAEEEAAVMKLVTRDLQRLSDPGIGAGSSEQTLPA